jgi:hypothetical protein
VSRPASSLLLSGGRTWVHLTLDLGLRGEGLLLAHLPRLIDNEQKLIRSSLMS